MPRLNLDIGRRNLELTWDQLGVPHGAQARQWTGTAPGTTELTPFRIAVHTTQGQPARVVAFDIREQSAASDR